MIKILIIEDEIPARRKLRRLIDAQETPSEIMGETGTVTGGLSLLQQVAPDLIIADIQLLDGTVFEIFDQVMTACPVIFTTSYDNYWMNAFETNGIEYLLKPFTAERFRKAWDKFLRLHRPAESEPLLLSQIKNMLLQNNNVTHRQRFAVQQAGSIYYLDVKTIVYFDALNGLIFAHDSSGKKHHINVETLKELEVQLDPKDFFRINRSSIVHKLFIQRIDRYTKNTLTIRLKGYDSPLATSQAHTARFRDWLDV